MTCAIKAPSPCSSTDEDEDEDEEGDEDEDEDEDGQYGHANLTVDPPITTGGVWLSSCRVWTSKSSEQI